MNEAEYHQVCEALWRRRLTPEEESRLLAYWAVHPEARAEAEAETALTQFLRQLPDVPVASNFTARVLQLVDLETPLLTPARSLQRWRRWLWSRAWLPRVAFALLVLSLVALGGWQYRWHSRTRFAQNVADYSKVAVMQVLERIPTVEIFQDFDAIDRLAQTAPAADLELLAALQ